MLLHAQYQYGSGTEPLRLRHQTLPKKASISNEHGLRTAKLELAFQAQTPNASNIFLQFYHQIHKIDRALLVVSLTRNMEGDDILAAMDSLWFCSSVLLQPPTKHKQSERAEELLPRQQQADTRHKTTSSSSSDGQPPKCVEEEAAVATERRAAAAAAAVEHRAAARSFCRDREWDERMVAWQMEQRRRTRVAAAARCSQARMPPPGEGVAMKAHLRSWAYAVACSVR